jgi:hypothetical protein
LRRIILLSFRISLTGSICAFAIGAPLGAALSGMGVLVVIANTPLDLSRRSLGLPFIPCL